jgi:ATP-dependent Clp protease ATP-binding subunit ClpA
MNFASQTETVRELMLDAMATAHRLGDRRFGTEHVLLALCRLSDSAAGRMIRAAGADPRDLMADVLRVAEKDAGSLTLLEARPTPLAERPDLPITPRVRRVIAGAEASAASRPVMTVDVLWALARDPYSFGANVLESRCPAIVKAAREGRDHLPQDLHEP